MPSAPRIELPRPAIIAALGVLLLAVTFLVTKAGDDASVSTPEPASSTPAQTETTPAGTTTEPAPAEPEEPKLESGPGLPPPVARALNANRVVVLFFYEPAAADDQATRAAVRAARQAGSGQASLFQDTVANISDYRQITGALGISQSPAMVVIDRGRKAELLQGYLDSGTIQQTVRDAL